MHQNPSKSWWILSFFGGFPSIFNTIKFFLVNFGSNLINFVVTIQLDSKISDRKSQLKANMITIFFWNPSSSWFNRLSLNLSLSCYISLLRLVKFGKFCWINHSPVPISITIHILHLLFLSFKLFVLCHLPKNLLLFIKPNYFIYVLQWPILQVCFRIVYLNHKHCQSKNSATLVVDNNFSNDKTLLDEKTLKGGSSINDVNSFGDFINNPAPL